MGVSSLTSLRKSYSGNFSTTSTTFVTALSINGTGTIRMIQPFGNANAAGNFRVTIDGNVFITTGNLSNICSILGSGTSTNYGGDMNYNFTQSLKIELLTTSASYSASVYWLYEM